MYARRLAQDVNEQARDVDEQFLLSVLSYTVCVCSRASVSVVLHGSLARDFIRIVPSVTVCVRSRASPRCQKNNTFCTGLARDLSQRTVTCTRCQRTYTVDLHSRACLRCQRTVKHTRRSRACPRCQRTVPSGQCLR